MKFLIITILTINIALAAITDFKDELLSPTEQPASYAMYAGLATTVLLTTFLEDGLIHSTQKEFQEDNKLHSLKDPIELMGRWVPNLVYITGMGLYAYSTDQKEYYQNAEIMFKATGYASLLTLVLKHSIRQQRPNSKDNASFPSGHTTTAFAFASVVADNHSLFYGIPAYILAGLVAMERMDEGAHYLHDVFAGATIGTMYGIGISRLIKRKKSLKNVTILPDFKGKGIIANYSFNF